MNKLERVKNFVAKHKKELIVGAVSGSIIFLAYAEGYKKAYNKCTFDSTAGCTMMVGDNQKKVILKLAGTSKDGNVKEVFSAYTAEEAKSMAIDIYKRAKSVIAVSSNAADIAKEIEEVI